MGMMVQLTKSASTVVAIIDFRDSRDDGVESIVDDGEAHKAYRYTDSLHHGVESIGDEGAAHKAWKYSC
jgi:hypothetical protein